MSYIDPATTTSPAFGATVTHQWGQAVQGDIELFWSMLTAATPVGTLVGYVQGPSSIVDTSNTTKTITTMTVAVVNGKQYKFEAMGQATWVSTPEPGAMADQISASGLGISFAVQNIWFDPNLGYQNSKYFGSVSISGAAFWVGTASASGNLSVAYQCTSLSAGTTTRHTPNSVTMAATRIA